MKNVAIKTGHQQGILALHLMHVQLLKCRHMHTNAIHGLPLEFRQTVPEGYPALRKVLPTLLTSLDGQLPVRSA